MAFEQDFAIPMQMEDYKVSDGEYVNGHKSVHPAYPFRMSARDLARFALLYLRESRWNGRQIISGNWDRESTLPHSKLSRDRGYGYMWWTGLGTGFSQNPKEMDGVFYASGWGHQLAFVFPKLDLVIVHRINSDSSRRFPSGKQVWDLLSMILAANRNG